jgi:hypothetical protein
MSRAVGSLIAAAIGAVLGIVAGIAAPSVISGEAVQAQEPVVTYGTTT